MVRGLGEAQRRTAIQRKFNDQNSSESSIPTVYILENCYCLGQGGLSNLITFIHLLQKLIICGSRRGPKSQLLQELSREFSFVLSRIWENNIIIEPGVIHDYTH